MAVRSVCRLLALTQAIFSVVQPASAVVHIRGISGGVNSATGERPARLELRTLQASGPAFDLFVLALKAFQEDDENDLRSFYQIAAIHGLPYESWDGVEGSRQAGYCSHGSTLFPVWHRPLLSLYEEMIWNKAQRIAASYPQPDRQRYVEAARTLRFPYWDWATNPELPESIVTPEIIIRTPTGEQTMSNPLWSFNLEPRRRRGFPNDGMDRFPETVRTPDGEGRSDIPRINQVMRSLGANLRVNTYELLTGMTNYTVFSTDSLRDRGGSYNSLEGLHNGIHGAVGGEWGHMTYTPWSAYDPIFWLHHNNIDRLFAIWQALYPDSYNILPLPNRSGDFVKEPGTIEDGNTPLTPFRYDDDAFWTAYSARSTRSFGYTFPEIDDWNGSPEDLARRVRGRVNALYNPRRRPTTRKHRRHINAGGSRTKHGKQERGLDLGELGSSIIDGLTDLVEDLGDLARTSLENFAELGINNLGKQWVINVKVDKECHPSPFNIYFFLGKPPANPKDWDTATNLVGTFITPTNTNYVIYNQIPLSPALAALQMNSLISSLAEKTVLPLLKKHLQWRARSVDGKLIDTKDFEGQGPDQDGKIALDVKIAGRDVEPLPVDEDGEEPSCEFPKLGEWEVYSDAVKERVTGFGGREY